jgi:hypothetical protein
MACSVDYYGSEVMVNKSGSGSRVNWVQIGYQGPLAQIKRTSAASLLHSSQSSRLFAQKTPDTANWLDICVRVKRRPTQRNPIHRQPCAPYVPRADRSCGAVVSLLIILVLLFCNHQLKRQRTQVRFPLWADDAYFSHCSNISYASPPRITSWHMNACHDCAGRVSTQGSHCACLVRNQWLTILYIDFVSRHRQC